MPHFVVSDRKQGTRKTEEEFRELSILVGRKLRN